MLSRMVFIYALSHNGNIFYIGKTFDLVKRYKSHLKGRGNLNVHKHVKSILDQGHYPIMRPLFFLERTLATKKEAELIHILSKAGHNLLNDTNKYKPGWPHEHLPTIINNDTILSYLKQYQKSKEDTYAFLQKVKINEQTSGN